MFNDTMTFNRRSAFKAGGMGIISAVAFGGVAQAAEELGALEKANLKVVADLLRGFNDATLDIPKMTALLTEDCHLRMFENKPPQNGRKEAAAAFLDVTKTARFDIKILNSFAKGPIVANWRADYMHAPGQPERILPIAGVFILKDGNVAEWSDYFVKPA